MDNPKKPDNNSASPDPEKPTESRNHSESEVEDQAEQDSPETSRNEAEDSGEPVNESGERRVDESPDKNPDSTEDRDDSATDLAEDSADDSVKSEKTIENSTEPYEDPYDPDGIYTDYNEFAADDEYAPEAEQMPERPDDPHYRSPGDEDRAHEETQPDPDKDDGDQEPGEAKTGTSGKKREKKAKEEEEEDDEFLDENEKELGGRMSFLDHLDELRKRIFHALTSVIVTFVAAWIFREPIFRFLSAPIKEVVDQLVVLRPTEPFTVYLKVSFAAAIFFAIPYIMLQVWLFIAPGLYRKEKIYALPFLFASSVLFILGGMFAYYIILPPALNFLLNDFGSEFQAVISAIEYYDFELIIIIGMGAIFQLPVVVAFLSMFGMVSPGFMWRNFKYAFLLITIIAAVVSPTTDPMNLFLWSGPMVILYTFSIGISWIFKRRRDKKKKLEEDRWSS